MCSVRNPFLSKVLKTVVWICGCGGLAATWHEAEMFRRRQSGVQAQRAVGLLHEQREVWWVGFFNFVFISLFFFW
jgi:hypothetical protein